MPLVGKMAAKMLEPHHDILAVEGAFLHSLLTSYKKRNLCRAVGVDPNSVLQMWLLVELRKCPPSTLDPRSKLQDHKP